MGLFSSLFNSGFDASQIKSAVIVKETQLYAKRYNNGSSLNWRTGEYSSISMPETVPNGVQYTFIVTYKDGTHKTVEAKSGTDKCDTLLRIVSRNDTTPTKTTEHNIEPKAPKAPEAPPFTLGKNQLPTGVYTIGKDIPAGTYDFLWVWGSGSFMKHKDMKEVFGESVSFPFVGDQRDNEVKQIINVICLEGEFIEIEGNVVLSIAKSRPVVIDL